MIAERNEKEKAKIIKDFDKMDKDGKKLELLKKKLGLGRWAKGGTKVIWQYDEAQYAFDKMERQEAGIQDFPAAGGPVPLLPPTLSEERKGDGDNRDTIVAEYESARALLEQGNYDLAEKAFGNFVGTHPKDELAGAAQYWLGVTYFVRDQHRTDQGPGLTDLLQPKQYRHRVVSL